jgi:VAD1 Analog of StAR-related lipid transfer domain
VLDFRVNCEGIPYGDAFAVQVRWVARRESINNIRIEVGVFVDFIKGTILKSRIESGATAETGTMHKKLFDDIRATCSTTVSEDVIGRQSSETKELPETQVKAIDELENDDTTNQTQSTRNNPYKSEDQRKETISEWQAKRSNYFASLAKAFRIKYNDGLFFAIGFLSGMICLRVLYDFGCNKSMLSSETPVVAEVRNRMIRLETDLKDVRESLVEIRAMLNKHE